MFLSPFTLANPKIIYYLGRNSTAEGHVSLTRPTKLFRRCMYSGLTWAVVSAKKRYTPPKAGIRHLGRFMRLSIKNRMQLLVALVILPFLLYSLWSSFVEMDHAESHVKENLRFKVAHVTEKIENLVEGTHDLLAATSRTITTSDAPRNIDRYLQTVNAEFPQYHNISVSDAEGKLLYSALDIAAYHRVSMSDRPWFHDVMKTGRFTTGIYFVGRITGKPSIAFLYPVLSSDGRVAKIVQASLNIDWLNRQILRHRLGTGEIMAVVDSKGTVVSSNDPAVYGPGTTFRETELFEAVVRDKAGSGKVRFSDKVERIVAYSTVKGASSPLYVIYGVSADSALADAKNIVVRDFLMVAVAIAVALLVSRLVGKMLINRPIEALSHAVSRLSGGDLGARTGIETRNDEIGLLAAAFDGMVEVLASRDLQQRELKRKARIDAALAELYPLVVSSGETFDEIACGVLKHAVELTGSSVAFISIIDPVTRWARSIAVLEVGPDNFCSKTRKSLFLEPGMDGNYSGLRGHALNTGVPFFTNEYLSHPGASRIPAGHFEITRFLSVPVLLEGMVAGQIALANPRGDYTEHDVEAVVRLAESYAFAIQRLRSEESIVEYQRQLQSMITELTLTQERERRQIASILHDEMGQSLALANIKLGVLESGSTPDDCRALSDIRRLVSDTIEISRSLTFEISPPVLYQAGLVAALESLAETFRKCHGLPVLFRREADSTLLGEELNILLYHSTRELLMNVLKHAEATSVRLSCYQKTDEIRISVSDDGNGMPLTEQAKDGHGFGLFSIRERLCHLNGKMSIESGPASGTTVTIQVPLNPAV